MTPSVAPTSSPRADAGPLIVRLVTVVFGALFVMAGATAAMIVVSHHEQWWAAWAAALAVSVVAAVLALGPVAAGLLSGVQYAAYGYLAGAFLRMMASLVGGLAAVLVFHTPAAPTLLILVPLYVAQVAAECVVLSRIFWPRPDGESSPT